MCFSFRYSHMKGSINAEDWQIHIQTTNMCDWGNRKPQRQPQKQSMNFKNTWDNEAPADVFHKLPRINTMGDRRERNSEEKEKENRDCGAVCGAMLGGGAGLGIQRDPYDVV